MTMYALIEHTPEGTYTASLIGWPAITAHGPTEAAVLSQLRQSLTTQLAQARIVPLDVELPASENPWLQLGEQFKNNPLLDEVTQAITDYRTQLDTATEGV